MITSSSTQALSAGRPKSAKRVLAPNERISEVLFGLIMVLTFTGSLSIADAGRDDVRAMLIGALGCNLAWGIIDGVFYLMGCLAEKGSNLHTLRAVHQSKDQEKAHRVIADALPSPVAAVVDSADLEMLRQRLNQVPEPPGAPRLDKTDWRGAVGVFCLVFLSTFPVTLPFIFVQNAMLAMRLSNAVAVCMLFVTGLAYGRCVSRSPWVVGLTMVGLGGILVAITIALGG